MIDDRELETRIASFPAWHFDFDLLGHHTEPRKARWQDVRAVHFIDPMVHHFGGSLKGKRVLDLGCNAGFFALKAIEAGCDFVLGIDARQMHIDQANLVFDVKGVDPNRYRFECANILGYPYVDFGPFDIVLCLGVLYHVNQPVSLFEAISAVNTDLLVIDTKVSVTTRGSWLELRRDSLEALLDAVDSELVMVPTAKAVMVMAEQFGYRTRILAPPATDDSVMEKYRYGVFVVFVCSKLGELSGKGAFQFQPLKALYEAQDEGLKSASWQKKKGQRRRWRKLGRLAE